MDNPAEQEARDFLDHFFKATPKASDYAIYVMAVSPHEEDPEDGEVAMAQFAHDTFDSELILTFLNALYKLTLTERGEDDDATATRH